MVRVLHQICIDGPLSGMGRGLAAVPGATTKHNLYLIYFWVLSSAPVKGYE